MFKSKKVSIVHALLASILSVLTLNSAHAGPGTLPNAPLFLSTIVEPNVYMTLDDSGSMDWGPLVKNNTAGLATDGGLPIIDNDDRGYYNPTFSRLNDSRGYLPPWGMNSAFITNVTGTYDNLVDYPQLYADFLALIDEWNRSWVVRTHQGNRNYYNPSVQYLPWVGNNADGSPMYVDADPTAALKDPSNPSGEKVDLTARHTFTSDEINITSGGTVKLETQMYIPTYFIWNDIESDGQLDQTDVKTQVEIPAGTAEMQNFANWFQYYRSRINATKAIIGSAINNTDAARTGMGLFNYGHRDDVKTMSDPTNKRDTLKSLYSIVIPWKTTPARIALENTGKYFETTDSSAPILSSSQGGECQQNFNILMSDGYWNGSDPSVGNTDIDGAGIFDGNQTQSNDGGNYADKWSNTLADIAMHDYERDLRSDLADKVPTQTGIDEADHQHLVTYSIAFGISGTLDPATADPLAVGFSWPQPVANTETTIDDMWHAAYNGRGKYLNSQDPEQLKASLTAAITNISERTGTAAAVAINSAKLSTESVVYLAEFNSNRWQGNLLAFPIIDTNTGELAATPKWDAASLLTARDIAARPRNVITYDNSLSVADGVAFQWSDISADMQSDLKTNSLGATDSDSVGQARLDYLRGDRSNEGSGEFFRTRLSMLGDIVNSGPVFVGPPSLSWPDSAPFPENSAAYSEFKTGAAATRQQMVYVGSNDGMMHAFDDATGEEVFAYIPGLVSSSNIGEGLHYLTEPEYVHNFYVDQTPTLSDVYISSGGSPQWHTVLVGGMRGGGRGIFALDVTDPGQFSETNADKMVLWEFTNSDDIDLGYTYSRPLIAYANDNTWVAIFGNGYNDLGSGEASLFIVNIEKGVDGVWQAGDYQKISTGVGTTANRNGLTSPALADVDGNGTVDRVYAGDLEGNMWVFDLSSSSANLWDVAYKSGSTPEPLFTAPAGQPITAKPVLAKHPDQPDSSSPSNAPNIMVFFGTGQYLVDADKTTTGVQSFYGVWDTGDSLLVNSDLIEQTFDNSFSVKVLSNNPVDYSIDHGWYFDLPETGERSVTSPIARRDTVFFNTFVPTENPCSFGGFGFKYAVDMVTGGSPSEPTYDANNDGVIDENDKVSNGIDQSTLVAVRQEGFLPEPVFIEDLSFTAEEATKVRALPELRVGRFSWQELLQ
jgi:type IV pilus assembly protein PilY1